MRVPSTVAGRTATGTASRRDFVSMKRLVKAPPLISNSNCLLFIFICFISAYYNPDEDDAVVGNEKKNALDAEFVGGNRKNSEIIVNQPLARYCSVMGYGLLPKVP